MMSDRTCVVLIPATAGIRGLGLTRVTSTVIVHERRINASIQVAARPPTAVVKAGTGQSRNRGAGRARANGGDQLPASSTTPRTRTSSRVCSKVVLTDPGWTVAIHHSRRRSGRHGGRDCDLGSRWCAGSDIRDLSRRTSNLHRICTLDARFTRTMEPDRSLERRRFPWGLEGLMHKARRGSSTSRRCAGDATMPCVHGGVETGSAWGPRRRSVDVPHWGRSAVVHHPHPVGDPPRPGRPTDTESAALRHLWPVLPSRLSVAVSVFALHTVSERLPHP